MARRTVRTAKPAKRATTKTSKERGAKKARMKAPKAKPSSNRALGLQALVAPVGGVDDRTRVLIALDNKRVALVESEGNLRRRLSTANATSQRGLLLEAIRQTISEGFLVASRFDAISSDKPFSVPPEAEERKLLAAIQVVGDLADANAAIVILVDAALDLVAAYPAKSTE